MDKIRTIVRTAKQHYFDLPFSEDELVRLALTESGGNPNAASPKGAYGLFQILIPTARETANRLKTKQPRLFGSVQPEKINREWLMQNPTKSAFLALEYLSQIYTTINNHPRYRNLSPYEKKTLTLMGYLAGPNRDPIRMAQTPLGQQYATRILGQPPANKTPRRGISNSRGGNPNRMNKKLADQLNAFYGAGNYTVQKTSDGYRIASKDPNARKPVLLIRIQKDSEGNETRTLLKEGDQNPIGQLQFSSGFHFINPQTAQALTSLFGATSDSPPAQPKKISDFFRSYYGEGKYTIQKAEEGYTIVPSEPNSDKARFVIRIQKDSKGNETRTLFKEGNQTPIGTLTFSGGFHYLTPETEAALAQVVQPPAPADSPVGGKFDTPRLGFYDPLQLYPPNNPARNATTPTTPETKPDEKKDEPKKTNPLDSFWTNMANMAPMLLLMLAMNATRGGDDYYG